MPLAFLTPLFLGGIALLAAPWLIHQIRRPEREPMRFSSLMFIPQTRKEVIERRRIQHILLMLLRMAMLAFLALAFSRPYWRTPATAVAAAQGAAWHVVLLDASYSMGAGDWFDAAKTKARSIVDSLEPTDRVGVIVFSRTPRVVAPLVSEEDPADGSPARARQTIESARLTEETTAYVPALQAAQSLFSSAERQSNNPPARFVAHLVSDFQRTGLPEEAGRWKLGPRVELRCVEVGEPAGGNCAIVDVSVRETGADELRVLGKVRNWSSDRKASRAVKLVAPGREDVRTTLTVEPGAARQVSFRIPVQSTTNLEGRLELENDPLDVDNRRYFARQAARQQSVLLLSDKRTDRGSAPARFLSSALPPEGDLPWRLKVQSPNDAKDDLLNDERRPSILIVGDLERLTKDIAVSIRRYVETGGRLLLTVDGPAASDVLNDGLLAHWGTRSDGPRHSDSSNSRFALLSWVDFDHPIFFSLRGPQFNDFSSVRFYNYQKLSTRARRTASKAEENPRVIARFEPDAGGREAPAMIEARVGEGRVVIWAFGMDLEWSNLPRSVKFIPMLYETLTCLGGGVDAQRAWSVGEPLRPPQSGKTRNNSRTVKLPGETDDLELSAAETGATALRARRSGFVRWSALRAGQSELVEAVNVRADESNPERISAEEFQLKLCAPRIEPRQLAPLDVERGVVVAGFVVRREYWRLFLGLLFAFFFIESWHAAAVLR